MPNPIYFVYDGECPFCSLAAKMYRVKQVTGEIITVNARDIDHEIMKDVTQKGYDLDKGMVIIYGDRYYHGADAVQLMGLLSSNSGWFNAICGFIFKYKWLSYAAYPFLKGSRNLALLVKGKPQLENLA
jgi:predicted DCC family thiol-disulfide oxidoreductase YuxK